MSQHDDDLLFVPQQFSGQARLFPLPNLVLFPHVVQPLHVFEPRYVEMLENALAGDKLITMALLEPGWEQDYEGRPPLAPVGCLGRVLSWQAQAGERFNILLLGLRRVRLERELAPVRAYREAIVDVLEDDYATPCGSDCQSLHRQLTAAFERILPQMKDVHEVFSQLSTGNVSLGTLTDVVAYSLDLDIGAKQRLLAEARVAARAEMLIEHLERTLRANSRPDVPSERFPPAFSLN